MEVVVPGQVSQLMGQASLALTFSSLLALQRSKGSSATQSQVFEGRFFLYHDVESSQGPQESQVKRQASSALTPLSSFFEQRLLVFFATQSQVFEGFFALNHVVESSQLTTEGGLVPLKVGAGGIPFCVGLLVGSETGFAVGSEIGFAVGSERGFAVGSETGMVVDVCVAHHVPPHSPQRSEFSAHQPPASAKDVQSAHMSNSFGDHQQQRPSASSSLLAPSSNAVGGGDTSGFEAKRGYASRSFFT